MRRAARLLPALAALFFLGACSAEAAPTALRGNAADDLGWGLNLEGGSAQLVFGVPDSDVLWFGFYCQPGSGQIEFADYGPTPGAPAAVTLVSGQARATAKVVRQADPLFEEIANGDLNSGEPVLAAFRRTGRLGMPGGPTSEDGYSAATAEEMTAIEGFFAACSRRA